MISAPFPPDEAERLAELQALEILDTPSEARFNRIVEVAARVFRTPIAYVAMIDTKRQWFKAGCGVNRSETERSTSFCSHTILQNSPMVVPDALSILASWTTLWSSANPLSGSTRVTRLLVRVVEMWGPFVWRIGCRARSTTMTWKCWHASQPW